MVPCKNHVRVATLFLIVLAGFSFGQDTDFTTTLGSSVFKVYQYIKYGVQIVLFIWFCTSIVQAVMGRDKETHWWQLAGIVAVIVILDLAPKIYTAIAPAAGSVIK